MSVAGEELDQTKVKRNSLLTFFSLIVMAFFLSYIPLANLPFSWMQTYFHEISHGIAAMLTGGSVVSIELHLLGSGLCTTVGGSRFIVAFSGYFGAAIWGAFIYTMVDNVSKKRSISIAGIMIGMIVLSALFWGRDLITLLIMGMMIVPFAVIIKTRSQFLVKYFLQFLGIYILLDSIKSPLHLIDGRYYGDGVTLSKLTGIPEIIWVFIWLCIGMCALYILWKQHMKRAII